MNDKEIMQKLQAPFSANEIEWRAGSTNKEKTKGLALAYVTNRAIQKRLDEVFGCFGWRNEFKEWKGNSQLCGISIKVDNEWVTKWDGADDSNQDAVKGGLSDAMKRAAYQWGIGRYLYDMPSVWVPLKNQKYLAEIPTIPDELLPENERGKSQAQPKNTNNYQPEQTKNANTDNQPAAILHCSNCDEAISKTVAEFSKKKYNKELCMKCQKLEQQAS